ncbi:MAG: hypothetical protein DMG62_06725 [Acidobacteria bacterium]|nr:MAG: hypothetical protein DMG62_06725 [Acidobacteriota bacterium]
MHTMRHKTTISVLVCVLGAVGFAADMRLPDKAVAGQSVAIGTSGSGEATLYVVGPGTAIKRQIKLGDDVQLKGEELRNSGYYQIAIKGGADVSKELYVAPAAAEKINFLARPSRVPVGQPKVIAGTAFVFDQFENLVTAPTPVTFELSVPGAPAKVERLTAKNGVSYLQTGSGTKAGPGQFTVRVGDNSVRRVVEETASEPCNLRFKLHKEKEGLIATTDPVRDCSGNAVPDGTIVTFISAEPGKGRSTVDARVKKGIARAVLPPVPGATISVASGVVLGNEVRWGGGE